ncbi:RHS repeat domain-containing protein [Pandoraea sp. PE-S2T-3]|uniref:RHS repeat domain-containing protein n=1 Tax=Pandoraea sp. PE-S2T-3 TaxID=1986993 RepID=UPI000B3FC41E|nr:RHS repeat-associated core domain-containing protein [Pandoraea sp. PE-S2T-3]
MTGTHQGPAQADSNTLYSGAQSFLSFLEKGVDPRTGTYSLRVALPKLAMNALTGPDLALSLAFDALQNADVGLGRGWSWGMSRLSPGAKRLSLADGETQLAIVYENRIEFPDKKLPTFIAEKAGDTLTVTYRSGRRERLTKFDNSDPLSPYVPVEIISPQGRSLHLTWVHFEGQPMLSTIADHERRELLRASRTAQAATIALTGTDGNAIEFRLVLSGDLVSSIELPLPGQVAWHLRYSRYTAADLAMLTEVRSPTGSVETIAYEERGHAFPLRAGDPVGTEPQRLPYVARHALDPGQGQPLRVTTYSYSTHNFLGFEAGVDWEDATDALYKVTSDYRYTSTESQLNTAGTAQVTIFREYDRFHGTRIERRTEADCEQSQLTEYHEEPGKPWHDQPITVNQIRTHTTRFRRGGVSRDDLTSYGYDAWGNTTEEIGPDGTAERTTYYLPGGEDGCPPDPVWDTPHTVKTTAMVPATAVPGSKVAATVTTRHRYALLPSMAPGAPGYLECIQQTLETPAGVHQTNTYDFENNPLSLLLHGRLKQQVEAMGGRSITTGFSYALADDTLVTEESTRTDFDDTVTQTSRHTSVISGLETRRESADEIVTYVYDALGRVVEETTTPKTGESAYTATLRHAFTLIGLAGGEASQISTTASGVVTTQVFEGTGLLVRETRMAPDVAQGQPHDIHRIDYDAFGRAAQDLTSDIHDGQTIAVTKQFLYDGWDQQVSVVRADGVTDHTEYDPLTQVETSWASASAGAVRSASTVRQMNHFDAADWAERRTVAGTLISRLAYTYDGLGRLETETDPRQQRTQYEYDFADRVVRTTLPGTDVIENDYVPHADSDEVAAIRLNGIDIGRREFDGLMRVSRQTIGGRTSTWAFDADRTLPREVRDPGGEIVTYDVNPSLPSSLTRCTSGAVSIDYDYDQKTGLLMHASVQTTGQPASDYRCERDASGNLSGETWLEGDTRRTTAHVWSLQGLPVSYTDVTGLDHRYRFETDTGRLMDVQCGNVTAALTYDALSRVREQRVTQAGQTMLTTTYSYDEAGREILREYVAPGRPAFSIEQQYDGLDLLTSRVRALGGAPVLTETFDYDTRGRLALYASIGDQAPHDPHDPSRRIYLQQWDYDVLDNITRVTTWHQGPATDPGIADYRYENAADPTQLTSLVYEGYGAANGTQTFAYDAAGRMIEAESGYHITYNALDQMLSVSRSGAELAAYRYNGLDEQCTVTLTGQPSRARIFRENVLVTEVRGTMSRVYLDGGAGTIDQTGALQVYALDAKGSVMQTYDAQTTHAVVYSPSGFRETSAVLDGVPGYDGETSDPATQWLWLGNARMYSPVLARFMVPDTFAPFDGGGINAYARIDPVNATDPSGHIPKWLAITIPALLAAVSITTAVSVAGGIKGVGIVLNVSARAALGKAGLAAAGSAATLAAAKGITVTTAVLSSAKIVGSAMGSLTMVGSSATRAADNTELAGILGAVGGTLSTGAFLFGGPATLRTYRSVVNTRRKASVAEFDRRIGVLRQERLAREAAQSGRRSGAKRQAPQPPGQGNTSPVNWLELAPAQSPTPSRASSVYGTPRGSFSDIGSPPQGMSPNLNGTPRALRVMALRGAGPARQSVPGGSQFIRRQGQNRERSESLA